MKALEALQNLITFMQSEEYPTPETDAYIRKGKQLLKKVTEANATKKPAAKKPAAKKSVTKK
jgi:hypothetical protein